MDRRSFLRFVGASPVAAAAAVLPAAAATEEPKPLTVTVKAEMPSKAEIRAWAANFEERVLARTICDYDALRR